MTLHSAGDPAAGPQLPRTVLEMVHRSGVNGGGIAKLGKRGQWAQMRSFVDVANNQAATDLYKLYCDSIGSGLLTMIWRDLNFYTLYGVKFDVIDVPAYNTRLVLSPTGGLGAGAVTLETTWIVCPEMIA